MLNFDIRRVDNEESRRLSLNLVSPDTSVSY